MKSKQFILGLMCGAILMSSTAVIAKSGKSMIEVMYKNMKIVVDGVELSMPAGVEPFTLNGTTYLPVRSISEALGKETTYDNKTNTVYLGKKPAQVAKTVTLEEAIKNAQVIDDYLIGVTSQYKTQSYLYSAGEKITFDKVLRITSGNIYDDKNLDFYTNGKYSKLKFKLVVPEGSLGGIIIGDSNVFKNAEKNGDNLLDTALFTTKDIAGAEFSESRYTSLFGDVPLTKAPITIMDYEVDISNVELLSITLVNQMLMLDPVLITSTN